MRQNHGHRDALVTEQPAPPGGSAPRPSPAPARRLAVKCHPEGRLCTGPVRLSATNIYFTLQSPTHFGEAPEQGERQGEYFPLEIARVENAGAEGSSALFRCPQTSQGAAIALEAELPEPQKPRPSPCPVGTTPGASRPGARTGPPP